MKLPCMRQLERFLSRHMNWDHTFRRWEKSWVEVELFLEKGNKSRGKKK